MVKFVHQILEEFENSLYKLGVFIDFPNAADTVDHVILVKKLKLSGINGNNNNCIKSYILTILYANLICKST